MKKLSTLLLLVLCVSVFKSNAQFLYDDYEGGMSVNFTYAPTWGTAKVIYDGDSESESMDLNALALNFDYMSQIGSSPVFYSFGAGLRWTFKSEKESYEGVTLKTSLDFVTMRIPLNLALPIAIPSTSITIVPFAGFVPNFHFYGGETYRASYEGESVKESINYFSEDDMGDDKFNWFVLGWQAGARIEYSSFYVGLSYEGHITNLYGYKEEFGGETYKERYNLGYFDISFGYKF